MKSSLNSRGRRVHVQEAILRKNTSGLSSRVTDEDEASGNTFIGEGTLARGRPLHQPSYLSSVISPGSLVMLRMQPERGAAHVPGQLLNLSVPSQLYLSAPDMFSTQPGLTSFDLAASNCHRSF